LPKIPKNTGIAMVLASMFFRDNYLLGMTLVMKQDESRGEYIAREFALCGSHDALSGRCPELGRALSWVEVLPEIGEMTMLSHLTYLPT
jgi:hypothetical protein